MAEIKNVVSPHDLSDVYFDKGINTALKIEYKFSYSIATLRTATNIPNVVFITDNNLQGLFQYDNTDTTSVDDGTNVIVNGVKRYKRMSSGTSDAFLLSRTNHTGTQAISTVSGLQTSLDSKGSLSGTQTWTGANTFNSTISASSIGNQIGGDFTITNSSEKLRIKNNGNVLVGTTTDAGYKFEVNGTSRFNSNMNVLGSITLTNNVNANRLFITGNITLNPQGAGGLVATIAGITYTDNTTATAGVVTHNSLMGIGQSTFSSTNVITNTNASTLYIAGAPIAGTNTTITNPYSLYVASGNSYFGGAVTANSTLSISGGGNSFVQANGFVMQSATIPMFRPTVPSSNYDFANNASTSIIRLQDDGKVGIGITSPASTLHVAGSQAGTLLTVSTATTLAHQRFIIVTAGVALTLPIAPSCPGRTYTINARSAGVTISSYTNLSGTSGQTSIANGTSITLVSDGTNWQQVQ